MCWEQLVLHFTLPQGEGILEKVKKYAFIKMAISFQTFKKNLKKGLYQERAVEATRSLAHPLNRTKPTVSCTKHREFEHQGTLPPSRTNMVCRGDSQMGEVARIIPATLHWPKRSNGTSLLMGENIPEINIDVQFQFKIINIVVYKSLDAYCTSINPFINERN